MARQSTHADYNATSRSLRFKVEIYFDGLSNPPVVINKSDYLISCSGLDETGSEDANPLGALSANEVDITLFNKDGRFNPANTTGPYYGKIALNVPIKVFIKLDSEDIDWDPLGVFYVTNWSAPSAGTTADVTAADILQQVFRLPQPNIPVMRNQSFIDFFARIFTSLGFTAEISDLLSEELNFTYANNKPRALLQELLRAAVAYCTTDKAGKIIIRPFSGSGAAVAILTDSDQINSITITQSALKTYDGVALTYNLHQLSEQKDLLDIKGVDIAAGDKTLDALAFNTSPVQTVTGIKTTSEGNAILIKNFAASTKDIVLTTTNNGAPIPCDINIRGIAVEAVPVVIADECSNPLKVESLFVQNAAYASRYQALLKKFVDNPMPIVELSIRGNPKLQLGDKVIINSAKYKLTFTGIIQRHTYEYTGGLKSKLTLLNALILEG